MIQKQGLLFYKKLKITEDMNLKKCRKEDRRQREVVGTNVEQSSPFITI